MTFLSGIIKTMKDRKPRWQCMFRWGHISPLTTLSFCQEYAMMYTHLHVLSLALFNTAPFFCLPLQVHSVSCALSWSITGWVLCFTGTTALPYSLLLQSIKLQRPSVSGYLKKEYKAMCSGGNVALARWNLKMSEHASRNASFGLAQSFILPLETT